MIGRNVINFARGNAAGFAKATKTALTERPQLKLSKAFIATCIPKSAEDERLANISEMIVDFKESSIPNEIRDTFAKYGAPKSGEFWTQSVSSFFGNLFRNTNK